MRWLANSPLTFLKKCSKNSGLSLKERREEEEQQQRELAERQEKISTWLELMKADGINPEELLGNSSAAAPLVKNASRVRRNINSPMLTVNLYFAGHGWRFTSACRSRAVTQ